MSYKYSRGSTVQGDIKAADDTQRDTMIDFGEDQIDFQTSGSVRLKIENDTITTTLPIHISGSAVEGLRLAKGGSDYRAIVFEVDGADNANISVSNAENFVIQNEMNGKDIQFWVNPNAGSSVQAMTIKESGLIGIGTDAPDYELDVAGNIGVNQYIYHNGDANTWINFTDNRIRLNAGGNNFIDCEDPGSAPHKVRINNGGNNIDFVIKDSSGNVYFTADASTAKIGIGTDTPSHKLDVDGDIRVRGNDIRDNSGNPAISFDGSASTTIVNNLTVQDYTFPASDGNADQVLQTNGSGQLSFVSISGGGGDDFDQSFSSISNATGDVDHDCSSTQTFLHSNISDSFVVNLTNFSLSSGDSTTVTLILTQGATAHFPSAIKIGGSAQEFSWKSTTYPSPTANAEEVVTFKILNNSGTYLVLADVDTYSATVPASPITSGSILYLDASNNSSYNGSGTTWTDLSGQNNHGTITNSPTFSSSTKLFTFDGVNDFVDLPNGFADFTSGITLFFIADFAGTNNSYERLIDLSNGADVDNILFGRETTTTSLRYDIRDGANGDGNVVVSNGVVDNTVASYAAVDNGTTIKLYRNGVLLTSSGTTNLPRNVTRTENFLAKSPWGDGFLEGKMGVAAVYTRALSDDEIAQNHNYYVPIYSL